MPSLDYERAWWDRGHAYVAGIDEAGRGAWAGPVMAGAVILPAIDASTVAERLRDVNDSKQLNAHQRDVMRIEVERWAVAWAVGSASNEEIDALGIVPATRLAMQRAIQALTIQPTALLIDAVKLPAVPIAQQSFNFADSLSLSVAAASILAKTERDRAMQALDARYVGYEFGRHKGYGTRVHRAALHEHGACAVHRMTFKPLRVLQENL